jgi:hypothetical protein
MGWYGVMLVKWFGCGHFQIHGKCSGCGKFSDPGECLIVRGEASRLMRCR